MENAQNETQQTGATQNETPQSNATSNNGNSNPKRSWIRRHPILSIILFVILFIIIISIATSKDESEDEIISKCEKSLLSDDTFLNCYYPCMKGNMTACYLGCFTKLDPDTCDYICEFQYNDDKKNIVSQYNETENNKKIDIEEACSKAEMIKEVRSEIEKERQFENSPRGICESGCNEVYTKNSETWRYCMISCKDMKSN